MTGEPNPFRDYHRARRRMTLTRVLTSVGVSAALAVGLGFLAGAAPQHTAPAASDGTGILGRSAHGDLAISANGITWRTLPAEGKAPGSHGLMEWGNMSPSWRTENGLVAQGVDAQGGRTRKLLLAAPTIP